MRRRGWKIGREVSDHIQIVDLDAVQEGDLARVIAEIDSSDLPAIVCIEKDQIVRSFRHGCTTPLDAWTFGWMMTGNDERPVAYIPESIKVATTNSYPLRGNHWSVDGNWNPNRETLLRHLRGPDHAYQLNASWNLEAWSLEELRSVHDDIHEREDGYRGRSSGYSSGRSSSGRAEPSGGSVRKPGRAVR